MLLKTLIVALAITQWLVEVDRYIRLIFNHFSVYHIAWRFASLREAFSWPLPGAAGQGPLVYSDKSKYILALTHAAFSENQHFKLLLVTN